MGGTGLAGRAQHAAPLQTSAVTAVCAITDVGDCALRSAPRIAHCKYFSNCRGRRAPRTAGGARTSAADLVPPRRPRMRTPGETSARHGGAQAAGRAEQRRGRFAAAARGTLPTYHPSSRAALQANWAACNPRRLAIKSHQGSGEWHSGWQHAARAAVKLPAGRPLLSPARPSRRLARHASRRRAYRDRRFEQVERCSVIRTEQQRTKQERPGAWAAPAEARGRT